MRDPVNHESSPFGNPDGAREPLEDLAGSFIEFPSIAAYQGLATRDDDLGARVIVGRKGAGKSLYLRRLQASAATAYDVHAFSIETALPATRAIVQLCQGYPEHLLTELWQLVWRRAIFRSLSSEFILNKALNGYVKDRARADLLSFAPDLFRLPKRPLPIYSQVGEIIEECYTHHRLEQYLRQPEWPELEDTIAEILHDAPPICVYLDGIDENYSHAPTYWMRCQEGLFYVVMALLREAAFGGRLHIFLGLREAVLSSVLRTENAGRYRGEDHVRVLDWPYQAARHFLSAKVARLPSEYFDPRMPGDRSVTGWLGRTEIRNDARGVDEPVESYLLRHTRLLPRDIVTLGNELSRDLHEARLAGDLSDDAAEGVIRATVARVAGWLGDEQLQIFANHLLSDMLPPNAARHGYSEAYTAGDEYSRGVKEDLVQAIRRVGTDILSQERLEELSAELQAQFETNSDVMSMMWQHQLVGYRDAESAEGFAQFYSLGGVDRFNVPLGRKEYVLHPCLIDRVVLAPSGSIPVLPWGASPS